MICRKYYDRMMLPAFLLWKKAGGTCLLTNVYTNRRGPIRGFRRFIFDKRRICMQEKAKIIHTADTMENGQEELVDGV